MIPSCVSAAFEPRTDLIVNRFTFENRNLKRYQRHLHRRGDKGFALADSLAVDDGDGPGCPLRHYFQNRARLPCLEDKRQLQLDLRRFMRWRHIKMYGDV